MFEMVENKEIRGKGISDNYECQKRIITSSTLEYFRKNADNGGKRNTDD